MNRADRNIIEALSTYYDGIGEPRGCQVIKRDLEYGFNSGISYSLDELVTKNVQLNYFNHEY
jgi:hypothetical protein